MTEEEIKTLITPQVNLDKFTFTDSDRVYRVKISENTEAKQMLQRLCLQDRIYFVSKTGDTNDVYVVDNYQYDTFIQSILGSYAVVQASPIGRYVTFGVDSNGLYLVVVFEDSATKVDYANFVDAMNV